MDIVTEKQIIKKNTIFTMFANGFLAIIKLLAGIFGNSSVLITDAINSLGDIATNVVVFISARFSKKGSDKEHPYGHEKIDSMISIFLGVALIVTAFEVGKNAITALYDYFANDVLVQKPHWIALVVAFATIVIKEYLFRKTRKDAKNAKSQALMAQALDHRSDTIASFGAMIGITGALYGQGYLDPIASIFIALFILRLGYRIIKDGFTQVIDRAADEKTEKKIEEIVFSHKEIKSLDMIKTRMTGMKIYVDLEIGMDGNISLEDSHNIAEEIHDEIENKIPEIIHCMIHVNPHDKKQ